MLREGEESGWPMITPKLIEKMSRLWNTKEEELETELFFNETLKNFAYFVS